MKVNFDRAYNYVEFKLTTCRKDVLCRNKFTLKNESNTMTIAPDDVITSRAPDVTSTLTSDTSLCRLLA